MRSSKRFVHGSHEKVNETAKYFHCRFPEHSEVLRPGTTQGSTGLPIVDSKTGQVTIGGLKIVDEEREKNMMGYNRK